MDKFIEVKEATKNVLRSSSADTRQTPRVGIIFFCLFIKINFS